MSEDPNRNLDKNHDQLNKKSSVSSPDSTVSVLLTSIGSSSSCSCSLIQYKDKLYSSASEALQAYIEDFDLSLTSSEITPGKICLCQSTPKPAEFSKHHVKGKRCVFSASTSFNKFWCFLVVFFVCFPPLPMVLQLLVSCQLCFGEVFPVWLPASLRGIINDAWSWLAIFVILCGANIAFRKYSRLQMCIPKGDVTFNCCYFYQDPNSCKN